MENRMFMSISRWHTVKSTSHFLDSISQILLDEYGLSLMCQRSFLPSRGEDPHLIPRVVQLDNHCAGPETRLSASVMCFVLDSSRVVIFSSVAGRSPNFFSIIVDILSATYCDISIVRALLSTAGVASSLAATVWFGSGSSADMFTVGSEAFCVRRVVWMLLSKFL